MTLSRLALPARRALTKLGVSTVLAVALLLSACSHKPLKAPCDLDEGKPTAMISAVLASLLPESLVALLADTGPCGPLRRIGQD